MVVPRTGAVALRSTRAVSGIVANAFRTTPRTLSSKPPEPAEVDDREEIERAMEVIVNNKDTLVFPRAPVGEPDLPEDPIETMALDPLPPSQMGRKVMISQNCKAATTSGTNGLQKWYLTFKNQERWSNPLMGWTSTSDPMSNMSLTFENPEQAVRFCQKRGWAYEVRPPAKYEVVRGKYTYAHNFLPPSVERDVKVNGTKTTHFDFPTAGASHYERPLNFHGTGKVSQHGNPETK